MATPHHAALKNTIDLCNRHLTGIVSVASYEFTSCYLWHDRPLYNDFGEKIRDLQGDTIYLYENSPTPGTDLFHELGHMIGRKCDMVAHRANGYKGHWQQKQAKLIAEVAEYRHWSNYLNEFARAQAEFKTNAASELWAELFMLWHLHPASPESRLIDTDMESLAGHPACIAVARLADEIRLPVPDHL